MSLVIKACSAERMLQEGVKFSRPKTQILAGIETGSCKF